MLLYGLCALVCGCLMCLLAVCFYRKALDNNDLNQVCLTGGGGGAQSRRLIKLGLGRSHLRIFISKWQRS